MIDKRRLRISKSRELTTYGEMWRTSYWIMEQAEREPEGSYFQIMPSLVFTAFTLEAYLNHVGSHIFGCWDGLEHLSSE